MNRLFFAPRLSAPKSLAFALGLAVLALAPLKLRADTFTYDLVLTDASDPTFSGTGVVTITGPSPLATYTNYTTSTADAVTGLSFVIDDSSLSDPSFNMADSGVNQSKIVVEFSELTPTATIWDITFADSTGASPNRLTLDSTGGYVFYYNNGQSEATGTFSAATLVDPAAAPEPSSLLLLGTGLLGAAGMLYRRRYNPQLQPTN